MQNKFLQTVLPASALAVSTASYAMEREAIADESGRGSKSTKSKATPEERERKAMNRISKKMELLSQQIDHVVASSNETSRLYNDALAVLDKAGEYPKLTQLKDKADRLLKKYEDKAKETRKLHEQLIQLKNDILSDQRQRQELWQKWDGLNPDLVRENLRAYYPSDTNGGTNKSGSGQADRSGSAADNVRSAGDQER